MVSAAFSYRLKEKNALKKTFLSRFSRVDIVAILSFLAVWVYFILRIRYVYYNPDEYYYLATAQRFVHGAHPLVDDWHLGQLSCLFFVLPYRLYVAIKGSTAGIVLFMRFLFLAFNAMFYWIMYTRLRQYKWHALVATLMFSAFIPGGIWECNYYSMPTRLIMIVFLILFSEKQTPASLLAAGVLLFFAGIYEPPLVFLYLTYSLLVWIRVMRKKRNKRFLDDYSFCLNPHDWKYISISAFLCSACFCSWLFARSGFKNILASIPYVLSSDSHHNYSTIITRLIDECFSRFVLDPFGYFFFLSALIIVILSIAFSFGAFRNRRSKTQRILFFVSCIVFILYIVQLLRVNSVSVIFCGSSNESLFWFGLECFLLCEQKNKNVFTFWMVGLFTSISIDFFSFRELYIGFPISYLAGLVFFTDLVRELYSNHTKKKAKKAETPFNRTHKKKIGILAHHFSYLICVCLALYCPLSSLVMNTVLYETFIYGEALSSFPLIQCEKGPAKHLFLRDPLYKKYNNMMLDIDSIKEKQPNSFFVFGLSPETYLYANIPCAGACTWMTPDASALGQQILYWSLNPTNRPECIYIPVDISYSDDELLAFRSWIQDSFEQICTYTLEEGESGFILYVSGWTLKAV